MARTKQTVRQIPKPSHAQVEHAFAQLAKKARQSSTTGTAIQSSAMHGHGSVLESLPEELWYIVLTHSDIDALARLALTNRLWALRVRPAVSFPCSTPFVYELITEAEDERVAKVLSFVEVRYGITLSDYQLGIFATGLNEESFYNAAYHNAFAQRAALLAGKGRAEQMAMLATRFGSMLEIEKQEVAKCFCQEVSSGLPGDVRTAKLYLTTAITLRLSPAEIIALAQDWAGFDLTVSSSTTWLPLAQAMQCSLSRAEWMPQQLAQLWTILLDEEEGDLYRQIESIGLLQVGAVIGLPAGAAALLQLSCCTQQVEEVVACLPSSPLERAAALFYLHCCVRDESAEHGISLIDNFLGPALIDNATNLLAASLVRMRSGVSAVCHVLHLVVQLAQLEQEAMAMENYYDERYPQAAEVFGGPGSDMNHFLVQFLRAWSMAAGYPTAFDYADQCKLTAFVHSLPPKPKAALAPLVLVDEWNILEWRILDDRVKHPLLSAAYEIVATGFVAYACRAMSAIKGLWR